MKSIRTKLVLLILALSVFALGALSFVNYSNSRQIISNEIDKQLMFQAKNEVTQINSWLLKNAEVVNTVGDSNFAAGSTESVERTVMRHAMGQHKDIADIYMAFEDKRFLDGGDWVAPAGYDPVVRDWYKLGRSSEQIAFTEPYIDLITKQPVVSAVRTVKFPDGSLRGVIGGDFNLATLSEQVNKIKLGETGYAFMVTNKGFVIAHPDTKVRGQNALESKDKQMAAAVRTMIKQGEGKYVADFQGSEKTLIFTKVPSTGWILGIIVPTNEIMSVLNAYKVKTLVVVLICILLMLLLTFVMANAFVKPILLLSKNAAAIAAGDLTVRTNIQSNDEIGKLAGAFNEMMDNIHQLFIKITEVSALVVKQADEMSLSSTEAGHVSEQIADTISDLAKGADEQANGVQHGASLVEKMVQSLKGIAANTRRSMELVKD